VLVRKLLEAGANANAARWDGESALMIAAGAGSADAVKLLAARGANVNAVEKRKGQTALMWAAAEGHSTVVGLLIQLGADVKARSTAGFTPLVFAAVKNDEKSVHSLIDAGADANYALPSGTRVLLVSTAYKSMAAANALVQAGADPNVIDAGGSTPLHMAAEAGDLALVKTLLAKGAKPDARTPKAAMVRGGGGGQRRVIGELTPLHAAARAGHEDVTRTLASAGADPLLKAQGDTTLLMNAASSGRAVVVKYVFDELDHRIDAVSDTGSTALHAALTGTLMISTQDEICEVVRFLLSKGAKADLPDSNGRTPLQLATRASMDKVAKLLAPAGH
jgi:ankyrin repeat protein